MAAPKKNPGNMCLYVCVSRGCFRHRSALANGFDDDDDDDDVAPLMMSTLLREAFFEKKELLLLLVSSNAILEPSFVAVVACVCSRFFVRRGRLSHTHTPVERVRLCFFSSSLKELFFFFFLSCLEFFI